ncbi:hypothetical protein I6U48_06935 [Clostridium sp. PL3]|uniref:Uncharacterized protein n=1 Tax=Clostridium thailandense TaxID=2794346 RepID=A0A949TXD0_9CLOT|nr:hypothetical protein [Clostridium thailandense]MBV7272653.1 hypothetical protein [Clostridium thailandense]
MKLSKKLGLALATIITSSSILLATTTTAQAKCSSIVILTSSGSYYEYSFADLKTSAAAYVLGDTVNGALYQHFAANRASINAYHDDARNVYVAASTVNTKAATTAAYGGTFDFNSYLENSSTPSTTVTAKQVKNNSGTITIDGAADSTESDFDVISIE